MGCCITPCMLPFRQRAKSLIPPKRWVVLIAAVSCLSLTAVTLFVGQSIVLRPSLSKGSSSQLKVLQSLLSFKIQPNSERQLGDYRPRLSTRLRIAGPSKDPLSVRIVAVRSHEDTSWLDVYLSHIPHTVWQIADAHAAHTTLLNKGNEASAYLEYIVKNYHSLPDVVLFSHGAG